MAEVYGGAIFAEINSIITIDGNSSVAFQYNLADTRGGELYSERECTVLF